MWPFHIGKASLTTDQESLLNKGRYFPTRDSSSERPLIVLEQILEDRSLIAAECIKVLIYPAAPPLLFSNLLDPSPSRLGPSYEQNDARVYKDNPDNSEEPVGYGRQILNS